MPIKNDSLHLNPILLLTDPVNTTSYGKINTWN